MRKIISGIYCILNTINGKRYIGLGKDVKKRIRNHKNSLKQNKHYNIYLQRSYNKYGKNAFEYSIIQELPCDEELLRLMEIYWIHFFDSHYKQKGYNMTLGGDGTFGYEFTEEILIKMRKPRSEIAIEHMRKPKSLEARKNVSIAKKGKTPNYKKETLLRYAENMLGEKNINSKLSESDILEIKNLLGQGLYITEIAKIFNVSSSTIGRIRSGDLWRQINCDTFEIIEGKNYKCKLSEKEVIEIKKLILDGFTNLEIANKYDISKGTISSIRNERTWKYVQL